MGNGLASYGTKAIHVCVYTALVEPGFACPKPALSQVVTVGT